MALRVMIADDHGLIRDGLKPFLEELADSVEISEAGSLDEAIDKVKSSGPVDLVILDLKMPGMDGLDGIAKMAAVLPAGKIVIMSGFSTRKDVLAAIEKGAKGFIPKTLSGASTLNALRLVLSGETYLPSVVIAGRDDDNGGRASFDAASPLSRLSERETEVLSFLIAGKTNKQIARQLELQEITVKIHLRNVYKKLAAGNRADAVRIALQNGWEAPPG